MGKRKPNVEYSDKIPPSSNMVIELGFGLKFRTDAAKGELRFNYKDDFQFMLIASPGKAAYPRTENPSIRGLEDFQ